jgi:thiamine kinase-like enzyme
MDPEITSILSGLPEIAQTVLDAEPLPGGLTNRNYLLKRTQGNLVLRIAGENSELLGIDRTAEVRAANTAFKLGIGPEVIGVAPSQRAVISRFVPGRVLDEDAVRSAESLPKIVSALKRYHENATSTATFSGFETVRSYHKLATERGVAFPPELSVALSRLKEFEEHLASSEETADYTRACHNDLLAANFILHDNAIQILDWEYAGKGDLFFDLGNLAANNLLTDEDERLLLHLYFGSAPPDHVRHLRIMRHVSDMRESMWGFLQTALSKFTFDYRGYALKHLTRFLEGPPV